MLSNYKQMDINILLSVVNMKLRNEKHTLDDFCICYQLDKSILLQRFEQHAFTFNEEQKQFKHNA